MNSRLRIGAALTGAPLDRVPVFPMVVSATARWAGVPVSRFAADPAVMADCLLSAQQRAGYDAIHVSLNVTVEAEAAGAPVEQPHDELPRVTAPPLVEPADLLRLRVPDPRSDGRLPVFVEATRLLARDVGDEVLIVPNIRGPLSMASQLRGGERLLLDLIDDPAFADELIAYCAEVGVVFATELLRAGGHAIMLGDALASPDTISPAMYRRFARPVHAAMFRRLRVAGAGLLLAHVCGDTRSILPDLVASGPDVLDVDTPVPLVAARDLAGPAIGLRGNLSPTAIFRAGAADVATMAREAIATGGSGRFLLGTGCEVAAGTPIENLAAMVAASNAAGPPPGRPAAA
jgi:MtaA/CmuA family methyltransferase